MGHAIGNFDRLQTGIIKCPSLNNFSTFRYYTVPGFVDFVFHNKFVISRFYCLFNSSFRSDEPVHVKIYHMPRSIRQPHISIAHIQRLPVRHESRITCSLLCALGDSLRSFSIGYISSLSKFYPLYLYKITYKFIIFTLIG